MPKPDLTVLRRCLTNLPDHIIYGQCWDLTADRTEYLISAETAFHIYKAGDFAVGREHFHLHGGISKHEPPQIFSRIPR